MERKRETKELKEGQIHKWNNLKRNGDPGETGVSQSSSEILEDLLLVFVFFPRDQPKPDNKVLQCIKT